MKLARYERTFAPEATLTDEELDENTPAIPDEQLTAEEKNWKKRYGDLRSHTQKQVNDLNGRIESLEEQLRNATSAKMDFPTSPEEVEAWASKYPQIAAIVETIAKRNAREVEENIEGRLKRIQDREVENDKKAAQLALERVHTDFFTDIKDAKEFHEWLGTKSKRTQDSIYENDTDWEWAAETVTAFKLETGWGKPKRNQQQQNRDAARDVPSNRRTVPGNGNEPMFKESQILNMTAKEYEANEEAIEKAQREGRIEYDIENARG